LVDPDRPGADDKRWTKRFRQAKSAGPREPAEPAARWRGPAGKPSAGAAKQGRNWRMASDQYEIGLKMRKEVLGDEYVDNALAKADDFNRDFQKMVTEYCWGGSWGRGVLTKQQRSILNLGMLAALNRQHEFRLHFLGALTNGVSIEEIREVLIQIAIYCGVPAGVEAFRVAREVFNEEGIDVSRMDSKGGNP
jgi:4-carboxymuconolactone decarboxylase